MLEMKKLLLEYKTKIKYYKKHKVNTDHLQTIKIMIKIMMMTILKNVNLKIVI